MDRQPATTNPPATPGARATRLIIVCALLPLAITGALALSASSTMSLATSAGVSPRAAPAAVAMLEIVSLTGTLLWVLVANRSLRRDAVLATLAASLVSLVAGLQAYGLFGAVAPVALVGTVHLASRAWREDWSSASSPASAGDADKAAPPQPVTVQDYLDTQPNLEEPAPVRALTVARDPENEQLQRARELVKQGVGRPTLKRELGVTDHRARQILAEVKQA